MNLRFQRAYPLALASLLALQSSAQPAAAPSGEIRFTESVLGNGMRVVLHEDRSTPVVNVQVWFHVGSKDEKPGRTGFAHLFEHLMFKGSKNVKPEEHDRIIQNAGGISNAYTNDDVTVYWQTVPSNYLETVLWLEADRLQTLDVSDSNFEAEREVVKEERLTRVENPPYGDLMEQLYASAYTVHPYRHMTIGSMEDLNQASLADVRDFYRTYYVPGNATLVLAGDFDPGPTLDLVRRYFERIPAGSSQIPRIGVTEPAQQAEKRVRRQKAVPLPAWVAGYHVPEDGHPDYYALSLASTILSDGRSSRLYRSLVYEKQLAVEASAGGNFTEDPNLFFAILIMSQGRSLAEGEVALDAEIDRLVNEPVTVEELEKARTRIRSEFTFNRQTVQEKASALGHAAVLHGNTAAANTEFQRFMAVTREDVQRVARKYLQRTNRSVVLVEAPAGGSR